MHGFYFGGEMHLDPWEQARGWLTACGASSGEMRWRYASSKPLIGAVTATAGNVVMTGELTGDLLVLDARVGRMLFRENIGGPIAGGGSHLRRSRLTGHRGRFRLCWDLQPARADARWR